MEKYSFSEQDANDMTNFLVPILDYVPEKRPTAAQCLSHPWINAGPRLLEPSVVGNGSILETREKDEKEAIVVGMRDIAIDEVSKPVEEPQRVLNSLQQA